MVGPHPRTVSVALCTFNSAAFIEAQLLSILDQTPSVSEVIIGDDGSSDDTLDRIRAVSATHPHGRLVRIAHSSPSGGIRTNFTRTMIACRGDIIALSDHDDVWMPGKVAAILGTLVEERSMMFSDATIIDRYGNERGDTLFEALGVQWDELAAVDAGHAMRTLIRRNIVTGATVSFTRDLLPIICPVPDRFVHDEWIALVAAGVGSVRADRRTLIRYRVHGGNQIGLPPTTPWKRFRMAYGGTRGRYRHLGIRAETLRGRLATHGADAEVLAIVEEKIAFEEMRQRLSPLQPMRVRQIAKIRSGGLYERNAFLPRREIVRDLIQPHRRER